MGDALGRLAAIAVDRGQMLVYPVQQQLEAFRRIAQTAEGEAAAGERSARQRTAQRFRA